MEIESMPLANQVDFIFRQMKPELIHLSAGTITIQIRNNTVGKFGISHNPIACHDGRIAGDYADQPLTATQVDEFRHMAVESLKYKHNWTHGELSYDFSCRKGKWTASITFASNYNLATYSKSLARFTPKLST